MDENQQPTELVSEHGNTLTTFSKSFARQDGRPLSTRLEISITSSLSSLADTCKPMTTSVLLEETIRRTIASNIRSTVVSPSPVPLRTTSCFQLESLIFNSEQHIVQSSKVIDTFNLTQCNVTPRTSVSVETTITEQGEPKKCQPNTNTPQRHAKTRQLKSAKKFKEIEQDTERLTTNTDPQVLTTPTDDYGYKSVFTKEYDQAILLQAHLATSNNPNDWSLKDFYRDVKTQFEPDTNTKEVFEKCLKLARLQAVTIKWEQRRRPIEGTYNRSIKSAASDRTTTLSLSSNTSSKTTCNEKDLPDSTEMKHDLRCNECKRFLCAGTCTGHSSSPSPNIRDQAHRKLLSRSARTASIHSRPRTTQQVSRETKSKSEQVKPVNPVVLAPSFDVASQIRRSPTPFANSFLPGKLFRSQRRDPVALLPTHKVSS
ncbi:unnamed protein product [Adineta ricciae]|uniref:Uncharacterized protein n=1 Tax=Adineta ricciae TaxID=249248 RepID=A0A813VC58_ADIRI|nr:unnamed protein product [Adineta ricciae]CAF1234424.1 unnamed protein product [Adineta ricciae]